MHSNEQQKIYLLWLTIHKTDRLHAHWQLSQITVYVCVTQCHTHTLNIHSSKLVSVSIWVRSYSLTVGCRRNVRANINSDIETLGRHCVFHRNRYNIIYTNLVAHISLRWRIYCLPPQLFCTIIFIICEHVLVETKRFLCSPYFSIGPKNRRQININIQYVFRYSEWDHFLWRILLSQIYKRKEKKTFDSICSAKKKIPLKQWWNARNVFIFKSTHTTAIYWPNDSHQMPYNMQKRAYIYLLRNAAMLVGGLGRIEIICAKPT